MYFLGFFFFHSREKKTNDKSLRKRKSKCILTFTITTRNSIDFINLTYTLKNNRKEKIDKLPEQIIRFTSDVCPVHINIHVPIVISHFLIV